MGEPQRYSELQFKRRSLQAFADTVLKDGKKRGRYYRIGAISAVVKRAMRKQGVKLLSQDLVITDDVILKYPHHPKASKGATLEQSKYYVLDRIVRHPQHVYQDITSDKYFVFVFAGKHSNGRVIKAIVQPNKKIRGKTFNWLKSIGVVERRALNHIQYKKLK